MIIGQTVSKPKFRRRASWLHEQLKTRYQQTKQSGAVTKQSPITAARRLTTYGVQLRTEVYQLESEVYGAPDGLPMLQASQLGDSVPRTDSANQNGLQPDTLQEYRMQGLRVDTGTRRIHGNDGGAATDSTG